uniref:Uncharacterized protein n=1 Tax=viral metagenome TaxID=1070528 RepID=A0A6H1ZVW2_9ZZZZ
MAIRTREEQREERRRYEGDVVYDVWRNGGNPDRVNVERIEEHFYRGDDCDSATRDELRHQRLKREGEGEGEEQCRP